MYTSTGVGVLEMKFRRFDLTSTPGINRIGKVCATEFRRSSKLTRSAIRADHSVAIQLSTIIIRSWSRGIPLRLIDSERRDDSYELESGKLRISVLIDLRAHLFRNIYISHIVYV